MKNKYIISPVRSRFEAFYDDKYALAHIYFIFYLELIKSNERYKRLISINAPEQMILDEAYLFTRKMMVLKAVVLSLYDKYDKELFCRICKEYMDTSVYDAEGIKKDGSRLKELKKRVREIAINNNSLLDIYGIDTDMLKPKNILYPIVEFFIELTNDGFDIEAVKDGFYNGEIILSDKRAEFIDMIKESGLDISI